MSKSQLVRLHAYDILLGTQREVFEFRMNLDLALLVSCEGDISTSWAACIPMDEKRIESAVARCLDKVPKSPGAHVKFLVSSPKLSPKIAETVKQELKKRRLTLQEPVVRPHAIHGTVYFSEHKVRIEKSLAQELKVKKQKIRVLIVDDSKTIRDLLSRILSSDPEIEIVGLADHPFAVEKLIETAKPDVITLDIHMPEMDGVTLLKKYMAKTPIPTLMISSITKQEGQYVFQALESGAIDYIQKPSFDELPLLAPMIIEKVKSASRSRIQRLPAHNVAPLRTDWGPFHPSALIALGASTGGTEALKSVLSAMPSNVPPILVVQHIPPIFSKAFANRLNDLCAFEVKEAEDGDEVRAGRALIAPGGMQMSLVESGSRLKVRVMDDPPMNRHKPSVDYLFHSIHKLAGKFQVSAALLTGMGADGAQGLLALKKSGANTVAQDEASCVVFGMPREAIQLGAAEKIATLSDIASILLDWSLPKRNRSRAS